MSAKEAAQLEGSPLSSVPTLHVCRYINCRYKISAKGRYLFKPFVTIVLLWALLGHGSFSPRQRVSQATRQGRSRSTSNRSLSLVKPRKKSIVESLFLPTSFSPLSPFFLTPSLSLSPSCTLFFLIFLHLNHRLPNTQTLRRCGWGLVCRCNSAKTYFPLWNPSIRLEEVGQLVVIYSHQLQCRLLFSQPGKGKVLGLAGACNKFRYLRLLLHFLKYFL